MKPPVKRLMVADRSVLNRQRRTGMTLLEVLVASGVLVLGLAGVAALLAAASTVVSQTSSVDEMATLVANARAEILNRQLCSLQAFRSGTSLPGVRTACFGELEQRLVSIAGIVSSATATAAPLVAHSGSCIAARIDGPEVGAYRSFGSEDRLLYGVDARGLPLPTIVGGNVTHDSLQRTCWGGLLTLVDFLDTPMPIVSGALPHPWVSGTSLTGASASGTSPNRFRGLTARLDVAVFKQRTASSGRASAVLLISPTNSAFAVNDTASVQLPAATTAATVSGNFVPGCSFVLALPPTVSQMPSSLPWPGQAGQGLSVLDQANGQVNGWTLANRFFYNDPGPGLGQRLFYLVNRTDLSEQELILMFSTSTTGAEISDGIGARTKTAGPYTVRLPTAQDAVVVFQSAPQGNNYWTSTRRGGNRLVWDAAAPGRIRAAAPGEKCAVALEVAVSPIWYRIQASWPQTSSGTSTSTFPVSVIISDPGVFEFPRVTGTSPLRVAAFDGLMGVESTYVTVE